jgi:hypothetical protein
MAIYGPHTNEPSHNLADMAVISPCIFPDRKIAMEYLQPDQ